MGCSLRLERRCCLNPAIILSRFTCTVREKQDLDHPVRGCVHVLVCIYQVPKIHQELVMQIRSSGLTRERLLAGPHGGKLLPQISGFQLFVWQRRHTVASGARETSSDAALCLHSCSRLLDVPLRSRMKGNYNFYLTDLLRLTWHMSCGSPL